MAGLSTLGGIDPTLIGIDQAASADSLLASLFSGEILIKLFGLWLAYKITNYLYRLSPFHPLAGFPGPRLAAATWLYEFYYDWWLVGQYTNRIKRMHDQYGPIVRVTPNELHCLDPKMFEDIFGRPGKLRNKDIHFLNFVNSEQRLALFGSDTHELHRARRAPLNQFFSRGRILALEDSLRGYIAAFCDKMVANPTKGEPFDLAEAFACFATDMICDYTFGEPLGHLASEGWRPNFRQLFAPLLGTAYNFRFFPPVRRLGDLASYMRPLLRGDNRHLMDEMFVHMPNRVRKAMANRAAGVQNQRTTVFTELLDSKLPDSEKTVERLAAEGFSINAAGAETTAGTLAIICFYLLKYPDTYQKLAKELHTLDVDPLQASWAKLETLPYLYGVIQEGLRITASVSIRLPRIAPNEELVYDGEWRGKHYSYVVPRGTPIGASTILNSFNSDTYPDPEEFRPERWSNPDGSRNRDPEKGFTPFGRGVRLCLGINLAMCELFHMTTAVALRIIPRGLKIHETELDDIRYHHCMMSNQPRPGSKYIQATMPYNPNA